MPEEARREAHVPAQHQETSEAARLPPPHAHPGGSGDHPVASTEGPRPAVRLIGRVRDRGTFEALRREGRRVRRGPVSVTFAAVAPEAGVRVAYGIGRRVGPAVVRNRIRRRLRAAARELAREGALTMSGAYLVTVGPGAARLGYAELKRLLAEACDALRSGAT